MNRQLTISNDTVFRFVSNCFDIMRKTAHHIGRRWWFEDTDLQMRSLFRHVVTEFDQRA